MPLTGFEPAILANERPQAQALEHAATKIGCLEGLGEIFVLLCLISYFRRGIHEILAPVDVYAS
jgi:hypothetical protein